MNKDNKMDNYSMYSDSVNKPPEHVHDEVPDEVGPEDSASGISYPDSRPIHHYREMDDARWGTDKLGLFTLQSSRKKSSSSSLVTASSLSSKSYKMPTARARALELASELEMVKLHNECERKQRLLQQQIEEEEEEEKLRKAQHEINVKRRQRALLEEQERLKQKELELEIEIKYKLAKSIAYMKGDIEQPGKFHDQNMCGAQYGPDTVPGGIRDENKKLNDSVHGKCTSSNSTHAPMNSHHSDERVQIDPQHRKPTVPQPCPQQDSCCTQQDSCCTHHSHSQNPYEYEIRYHKNLSYKVDLPSPVQHDDAMQPLEKTTPDYGPTRHHETVFSPLPPSQHRSSLAHDISGNHENNIPPLPPSQPSQYR